MSQVHTLQNPETRERFKYFKTIATRWIDNDIYGHVNNAVYYNYVDTVANAYLIEQGVLDIHNGKTIGFAVESGCQYRKPLAFPQDVDVGIRIAHIGNSSARYEIGMFNPGEDVAAAASYFVHVFVNRKTQDVVRIPDNVRQVLENIRV
ncbi:MAG: acyl-CoA thioesterase [Arenicellales bacterium WSBS_2016_MAG_OTU3]